MTNMRRTGSASLGRAEWRKWYKTKAWQRLRYHHLKKEPLCRYCQQEGKTTEAQAVDHITPHKGDNTLFHDPANLMSLCFTHHNSAKQKEEKRGQPIGCDVRGNPVAELSHWK